MFVHDFNWSHVAPAMSAAFLASMVEFIEALTIVLAVGVVRGWRHAIGGALGGVATLGVAVLMFGDLLAMVPIDALRFVVGMLLLLFGMRWLHKAVLRQAGIVAHHDEEEIYTRKAAGLAREPFATERGWDPIAFATAFKAVVLEGLEVVFIVIAVGGADGTMMPASVGAALAGFLVIAAAIVLRRPLTQVPENVLKFAVGVLISAFGVFWLGEGLKLEWPGGDLAIALIATAVLAVAMWSVMLARYEAGAPVPAVARCGNGARP